MIYRARALTGAFQGFLGSAIIVAMARVTAQVMQFILFVYAAKILSVAEFGKFSMILIISLGISIFAESGWQEFVIQERSEAAWRHVNAIAGLVSLLLTILALGGAAITWLLWRDATVLETAIVLAGWIVLRSLTGVQAGILTVRGDLGILGTVQIIAELCGFVSGVVALHLGYGIVALAISKIFCQACYLGGYILKSRFKGFERPDRGELRRIVSFSKEILSIRLTRFIQANIATLLMGIWFGPVGASIYRAGQRIVGAASEILAEPSRILTWSHLRRVRDKAEATQTSDQLRSGARALSDESEKVLLLITLITSPIFAGLAFASPQIVSVLLGAKWMAAVPIIQILCIANALRFVLVIAEPLFSMLSDPRIARRLTTIGAFVLLAMLPLAAPHGLIWVAFTEVAAVLVTFPLFFRSFRASAGLRFSRLVPSLGAISLGIALFVSGWWALASTMGWQQRPSLVETAILLAAATVIYGAVITLCGALLWRKGLLPG